MSMVKISIENSEYQIISSLKLNREKRSKLKELFIEGTECIKQAVSANYEITRIIINNNKDLSGWGKNLIENNKDAKIINMSDRLYNELSDKTNPSEMLVTVKMKQNKIDEITDINQFILVFDRPSDHGNLGSIIRSANAFGVDAVFIAGHGADAYESKVIRASMGSVFHTKIFIIESMEKLTEFVKTQKDKNNMQVIGTDSKADVSLINYKLEKPIMLIIGNEAKGMSKKLIELCDKIIKIPMKGDINSLNVSNAASILMWEIFKS